MAFTRAKDGLYLTEAEGTGHENMPRYPSRFLLEIDPATLEFSNPPTEVQMQQAKSAYGFTDNWIAQMSASPEIPVGHRICHSVIDQGTDQDLDLEKRA